MPSFTAFSGSYFALKMLFDSIVSESNTGADFTRYRVKMNSWMCQKVESWMDLRSPKKYLKF